MVDNNPWQELCGSIQQRLLDCTDLKCSKAKNLRQEISRCLVQANNAGVLSTKLHEIHSLLQITKPSKDQVEITGGARNFKRRREVPHFERADGCWFDFSILVDERVGEVIGFDFEIRFPTDSTLPFLRFDLNTPGHNNEEDGIRFHIHPGNDDLMIPSAPLQPLEILHLFLYGLKLKEGRQQPRSQT